MEISTASRVLISTIAYATLYWLPLSVMYTTDIYIYIFIYLYIYIFIYLIMRFIAHVFLIGRVNLYCAYKPRLIF